MNTLNRFFCLKYRWVLVILIGFVFCQPCYGQKSIPVPDLLEPWTDWVLHGKEKELACVPQYNNARVFQCSWPSKLTLRLDDTGGTFTQSWQVYYETWVTLPGDSRHWPRKIRVDGQPVVVLEKQKKPQVLLRPGTHMVTGEFSWKTLPKHLRVPPESGLLSLAVKRKIIEFPNLDTAGRLWLKQVQRKVKMEDQLKINSFRLIQDSIPARVLLQVDLEVAGSAREIALGPLFSPGKFIPVSLNSPLPARLEKDARMRVQVRPGRYTMRLDLRHSGPLKELGFGDADSGGSDWPNQEIWSFVSQPDLRLVEIQGVASIDPVQTSMPKAWQQYPAYLMGPESVLRFKEIKRGDPRPAPDQMRLDRELWLRFDGSGYTIRDRIRGQKNTDWRLEIDPGILLGRVSVDGKEQLITQRQGSDRAGIELRNGQLNFTADSSWLGKISALPATGWDHDFTAVNGRLNLPPGWKLINATGIDNIPGTWIKQWTLLDFFMVLIFTIALAKLYSKPLAGIAFITLVLIFHEPDAPRFIWLALLIGFALLKYLPEGSAKKVVRIYQCLTILAFVVIVIPYTIQALRIGIYPQLARPWTSMTDRGYQSEDESKQMDMVQESAPRQMAKPAPRAVKAGKKMKQALVGSAANSSVDAYYRSQVMQYDPKAVTQTGPGMPQWTPFETIDFRWSGPVTRDQQIGFTLIGPKTNLVLAFARVLLILLLGLGMFGFSYSGAKGVKMNGLKDLVLTSLVLALLLVVPGPAQSSEIPSSQLLGEFQERLLEKDQCFPSCADIQDMVIQLSLDRLSIIARIDAQVDAAVPVPGRVNTWLPGKVMIDKQPAVLFRQKDRLWVMVPKGKHLVEFKGAIRPRNTLELPFHLIPHHVEVKANGWLVEGLHPDGTFDSQLQFKRIADPDEDQKEIFETGVLPAFAQVERTILLGLVWKVKTRVKRVGPKGSAMVMDIPLLPGESVTTQGIRVWGDLAKIHLRADQSQVSWESFLTQADTIELTHKKTDKWTEIWKVDVSPVFHMSYEGIPVILHKTGTRWYPTWHPWPGERVGLSISRPKGVGGQTLTIQDSHLELRPGRNTTAAKLRLSIKSSQGGQHTITLPADAKLQGVKIAGRSQPIRQDGQQVTVPITPGKQNIELQWIEARGMTARYQSSRVDLGMESVNASVDIRLPRNRWPLFLGGDHLVGPAVLFWSVIIMVVLGAFGLSKTGWASLKFYQWLLLGIGISMSNLFAGLIIVGWLVVLDFRQRTHTLKPSSFNLVQVGIAALTLGALASLVFAISQGLLGHPDMNILGNGSTSSLLRWYHDVAGPILPRAWVISIPMLVYRLAMLAWALWISFWLVGIIRWGWQQFSTPTIWQKMPLGIRRQKQNKDNTPEQ